MPADPSPQMSLIRGIPLEEEQGIGALTIGGWLGEVTTKFGPQEAAVHWLDGARQSWSYADLWDRSMAVAKALTACGVGKGCRVGILVTNRLEFLSCAFGTALAGGVATTISSFFTTTELGEVLGMAGCSVLLVERKILKKDFAEMLAELDPAIARSAPGNLASQRFPFLTHLALVDSNDGFGAMEGWETFLARGNAVDSAQVEARAAQVQPSDPAVLFFSSGSTGKAKGILSAHRGVCLQLWRWPRWYNFAADYPVRTWSANGFFWSGNFAMALGGTLSVGGCLVLQRWFDAGEALTLMDRERATMILAWPHQWAQIEAAANYATVDLSAMRYIDATTPLAQHPTISTDWLEPKHAYGNTETFTLVSAFASGLPPEITGSSVGEATAGASIKIVDPLTGALLPLGERGELAVKGPTLMMGYLGVPLDQTLDDEGYFHTNDGGYVDRLPDGTGRLYWEGRLNDIIKTGGANVSPLEIDAVLRALPGVKVTQTVGIPDALLGEMVVSCIELHDGAALDEDAVRNHARQTLASYKVPRRVLFFAPGEIALTGSAKIKASDVKALAQQKLAVET